METKIKKLIILIALFILLAGGLLYLNSNSDANTLEAYQKFVRQNEFSYEGPFQDPSATITGVPNFEGVARAGASLESYNLAVFVEGLSDLPKGYYYNIWIVNPASGKGQDAKFVGTLEKFSQEGDPTTFDRGHILTFSSEEDLTSYPTVAIVVGPKGAEPVYVNVLGTAELRKIR